MVLSSILPEQVLYGFVGVVLTHDVYFGIALQAAIWFSMTWTFIHRPDPPPLDIHVHVTQPAMTWFGALVGVAFVAFTRTPRFVSARLWDQRDRFTPWFFLFVLAVLGATAGGYLILNDLVGGGVATLVAFGVVIIVLLALYFARVLVAPVDGVAQAKYILLFALLVSTPAAYDIPLTSTTNQSIRPFQTLIFTAAFLFVIAVMYVFTVYFGNTRAEDAWWHDRWHARRHAILWIFLAVAFFYVPAMIADEVAFAQFGVPAPVADEERKIFIVMAAVLAGGVAFLLLMAVVWAWRGGESLQLKRGDDAGAGTYSRNDRARYHRAV